MDGVLLFMFKKNSTVSDPISIKKDSFVVTYDVRVSSDCTSDNYVVMLSSEKDVNRAVKFALELFEVSGVHVQVLERRCYPDHKVSSCVLADLSRFSSSCDIEVNE